MKVLKYPQHKTLLSENSLQNSIVTSGACCLFGSIFLALMAQLSINLPFTPVPITMQTLALFLLIIAQGKHKATGSVVLYLTQASMGLPVLAGGAANPLWVTMPSAGYLLGFVACAWVAGSMLERKANPGFIWTFFSLSVGMAFVYLLGTAYLSAYVGWEHAFQLGVLPFLSGCSIKLAAASAAERPIARVTTTLKEQAQKLI